MNDSGPPPFWENIDALHAQVGPTIRGVIQGFLRSSRLLGYSTQQLEDLEAEVWISMLDHDRRFLRGFDPDRGDLPKYVSVKTRSVLKDARRKWSRREGLAAMLPLPDGEDPRRDTVTPEDEAVFADLGRQTFACVTRKIGDDRRKYGVFELDLLDHQPPERVEKQLSITRETLYRLRNVVKGVLQACWNRIMNTKPSKS